MSMPYTPERYPRAPPKVLASGQFGVVESMRGKEREVAVLNLSMREVIMEPSAVMFSQLARSFLHTV